MAKITVVGMGPGTLDFMTIKSLETLKNAAVVSLRTARHPVVKPLEELGCRFESYDDYYEQFETFDEVYEAIASDLLKRAMHEDIVYAVPGSPFVAENTVERLIELAPLHGIELDFVHGTSFLDAMIHTLKIDPVSGLSILDAFKIENTEIVQTVDLLILQVYDQAIGSMVKLRLMDYYPDDHDILIVRAAGIPGEEKVTRIPLYQLDRAEHLDALDHLTSLWIPRIDTKVDHRYRFSELVAIMKRLRDVNGCPWDRKQTHQSLRQYLIEEAYEVVDTIDNDDLPALEEELGDVLLQVVFHSEIAAENGYFDVTDVISGICRKLIHRHPHVFGELSVEDAEEVVTNWEQIKREEKAIESVTEAMKQLPMALPSTLRAYKAQKKAAVVGFDWPDVEGAFEKIHEEIDELLEEMNAEERDESKLSGEVGDLLFAVINVSRFLKVNPELALNKTIEKFIRRFQAIEESEPAKARGLGNLSLSEMDNLWNRAKINDL
ncbi:MAG: nucleoside triphosphate pyrophosphohydrolase [Acidaminobacter sp.]|uniref:nucleoside triphosphate pyrophosphohydrolase n=1 Tax=Acidaminobacter sp. TaxID=1872102 RepID=UPI0013843742|nr:nucleoside triphosphate pyrophosphohydrolase [Acidaminobacter sp.]MZQ96153.1 nucleoside triphosphate pyrophosphohydrolase [Acidaminobacter sp.]